jgi:hypothetical protein
LAIAALGVAGSACNDNNRVGLITSVPPVAAVVAISPSLIGLTSLSGFNGVACPGFAFSTSFNLVVVSSGVNLAMNNVTLTLLDGTTLGGPTVTIPSGQLNALFGTTLVLAGTSQTFPLKPVFSCSVGKPRAMTATVLLTDERGGQQSEHATAAIR